MKTVKIVIEVEVDDEARFVTIDKNGTICAWDGNAFKDGEHLWYSPYKSKSKTIEGRISIKNWRETLTKVNHDQA